VRYCGLFFFFYSMSVFVFLVSPSDRFLFLEVIFPVFLSILRIRCLPGGA